MTQRQTAILLERDANGERWLEGIIDTDEREKQNRILMNEYKGLTDKKVRLSKKIRKIEKERDALRVTEQQFLKVSEWNPSKPLKERPFSGKSYLADPLDRVRHTMYHEIGHQIHQTYKFEAKKRF